jgi:hypothetical protein
VYDLVFEEEPFNPLEEPGSTTLDYPMDGVDNSDDSLTGHDDGWVAFADGSKSENPISLSINATWSKTKLSFEDIPILFQMAEEATHIIRYFVIERRLQLLSPNDESGIGQTDGLEGIAIWRRREYSWGMHSIIMTPTKVRIQSIAEVLKWWNVPFDYFGCDAHTRSIGTHHTFLSNEDKFKKEIADLELESVFEDMILCEHPTDSTKKRIESRNKLASHNASLGYIGNHLTKRNLNLGITEPLIVKDTWCYVFVALKFSCLQEKMATTDAGFVLYDRSCQFQDSLAE